MKFVFAGGYIYNNKEFKTLIIMYVILPSCSLKLNCENKNAKHNYTTLISRRVLRYISR